MKVSIFLNCYEAFVGWRVNKRAAETPEGVAAPVGAFSAVHVDRDFIFVWSTERHRKIPVRPPVLRSASQEKGRDHKVMVSELPSCTQNICQIHQVPHTPRILYPSNLQLNYQFSLYILVT